MIVALVALSVLAVQSSGQEARATTKPASPPSLLVSQGLEPDGALRIKVNKSAVITTKVPVKMVSLAQPEVAGLNQLTEDTILITGKKAGNTQLIIWDQENRSQVVNLLVLVDLEALQEQLKSMFPGTKIEVQSVGGALSLRGQVPSLQVAEQAVALATPYISGKVLNFLEIAGGQQVMLQVRFAEVSRQATSQLGANFGFTDGIGYGASNIGQISPLGIDDGGTGSALAVTTPSPSVTLFGRAVIGRTAIIGFLTALRQNNLMRILAEPNLITSSGQEASFLAGGEFPVPIVQGGTAGTTASITVQYREYGVKLRFVPVVLGDGRIRLKVAPEVSDLDYTAAVRSGGFLIPGLTKRTVDTTVELNEGQTLAIAGLLNNQVVASKDVTPLLGDLPVVGALFRSVRYQKKETELVVLVTPVLVEAMNPSQVPALPGQKWRHPTENELFWDRDLGGPISQSGQATATQPTTQAAASGEPAPRFQGEYGFSPAAAATSSQDK
jgi:pilus assembly protein CpaC